MQPGARVACSLLKQALENQRRVFATEPGAHSWKWLRDRGHNINPCRSKCVDRQKTSIYTYQLDCSQLQTSVAVQATPGSHCSRLVA